MLKDKQVGFCISGQKEYPQFLFTLFYGDKKMKNSFRNHIDTKSPKGQMST